MPREQTSHPAFPIVWERSCRTKPHMEESPCGGITRPGGGARRHYAGQSVQLVKSETTASRARLVAHRALQLGKGGDDETLGAGGPPTSHSRPSYSASCGSGRSIPPFECSVGTDWDHCSRVVLLSTPPETPFYFEPTHPHTKPMITPKPYSLPLSIHVHDRASTTATRTSTTRTRSTWRAGW